MGINENSQRRPQSSLLDQTHMALLAVSREIGGIHSSAAWASEQLAVLVASTGKDVADLTIKELIDMIGRQDRMLRACPDARTGHSPEFLLSPAKVGLAESEAAPARFRLRIGVVEGDSLLSVSDRGHTVAHLDMVNGELSGQVVAWIPGIAHGNCGGELSSGRAQKLLQELLGPMQFRAGDSSTDAPSQPRAPTKGEPATESQCIEGVVTAAAWLHDTDAQEEGPGIWLSLDDGLSISTILTNSDADYLGPVVRLGDRVRLKRHCRNRHYLLDVLAPAKTQTLIDWSVLHRSPDQRLELSQCELAAVPVAGAEGRN